MLIQHILKHIPFSVMMFNILVQRSDELYINSVIEENEV